MGYDHGDSFAFDFEPNGTPFVSKSKGKLSPRSYPIQFERKWKYSFFGAHPRENFCISLFVVPSCLCALYFTQSFCGRIYTIITIITIRTFLVFIHSILYKDLLNQNLYVKVVRTLKICTCMLTCHLFFIEDNFWSYTFSIMIEILD